MISNTKKIIWAVVLVVVLAAVLNFFYIQSQITFLFKGGKDIFTKENYLIPAKLRDPNTIEVESLSIKAPIVYVDQVNEKAFQQGLLSGVVHYPGTANPGQTGNCYIFGHSSDYFWSKGKYKTVFALLPSIKIGDRIIATNEKGEFFVYIVYKTAVVSPKDTEVLSQNEYKKKLLTLQTSWPIGTALKRFVAVAELEQ